MEEEQFSCLQVQIFQCNFLRETGIDGRFDGGCGGISILSGDIDQHITAPFLSTSKLVKSVCNTGEERIIRAGYAQIGNAVYIESKSVMFFLRFSVLMVSAV